MTTADVAAGTYAPSPRLLGALEAAGTASRCPTGDGVTCWRGDLYPGAGAPWRSNVQIAAAVRADVKAAVAAGDLPGKAVSLAYSVRAAYPQEVTITVSHRGEDPARRTGAWSRRPAGAERSYYDDGLVVREDVRELARALSRMARRYVRSEVDALSDLYNVSCLVVVAVAGGGSVS